VGTGSGSRTDPYWFRNLRAAGETGVQIRDRHLRAQVREFIGEERDHVWQDVLREAPEVEKHAQRGDRVIPVAVPEPCDPDSMDGEAELRSKTHVAV
jgi:deazaflavin-dependent oxidoreductase (nitroreductase family)